MRSLDRTGQGLTASIIALFAIPPVALLIGMASERSFWVGMLSWMPLVILPSVMRTPLRTLRRVYRLLGWFCIGVTSAAFFFLGRGGEFNLIIATVCGLALTALETLGEYLDKRKMADK